MTIIPEELAYAMLRNKQEIRFDVGQNPGYGVGCGVIWSAALYEQGYFVTVSCGPTIEIALKNLVEINPYFNKAVV